jgi:hypothetical protein
LVKLTHEDIASIFTITPNSDENSFLLLVKNQGKLYLTEINSSFNENENQFRVTFILQHVNKTIESD